MASTSGLLAYINFMPGFVGVHGIRVNLRLSQPKILYQISEFAVTRPKIIAKSLWF